MLGGKLVVGEGVVGAAAVGEEEEVVVVVLDSSQVHKMADKFESAEEVEEVEVS